MAGKKSDKHIPEKSLWDRALAWSDDEWRHELVKLSPEDVSRVISAADLPYDPINWHKKLASAISGLNDRPHLEAAGRSLSINQSREIFSYIDKDHSILDKLSPLFVGMSHEIFRDILFTLTPKQLQLLKQEALTEAIQHHLTLVISGLKAELNDYQQAVYDLGIEISELPLTNITHKEIASIDSEIEALIDRGLHAIKIANSALSIAWNTLRLDIIDELSQLKEGFQRFTLHNIGSHRNHEHAASGLHAILQSRLNTIFIDRLSQNQFETLSDDTPAIEALVKLGIWYEQDYIDFGLLSKPTEIIGTLADITASDRANAREKSYLCVNERLRSIGLNTLKDLKKAGIYSRKALQEFISRH